MPEMAFHPSVQVVRLTIGGLEEVVGEATTPPTQAYPPQTFGTSKNNEMANVRKRKDTTTIGRAQSDWVGDADDRKSGRGILNISHLLADVEVF